ncbi:MAG TPA: hypothetical protein PK530_20110, partial [Anaerolineales bacterium]|nr:hypothetical protein [Anaerolineales bacterium]
MSEIGPSYEERMRILEMIEQGVISSSQGAELIRALEVTEDETEEWDDDPEPLPDPMAVATPEGVSYTSPTPAPAPEPEASKPPRVTPSLVNPLPSRFARWRNW